VVLDQHERIVGLEFSGHDAIITRIMRVGAIVGILFSKKVAEEENLLNFDLQKTDGSDAYRLLASVVVPRPIALVTSRDAEGRVNAAPFSFFNLMGSDPPVVALGIGDREPGRPKDTRANIERTGEFVINLVDERLAEAMNICGIDFPATVDEMTEAGLTQAACPSVSVPRIAESPVGIGCRLHSIVEVGRNRIVLAEAVSLFLRDEFYSPDDRRVDTKRLHLIGRMHGGGWYARTTDLFEMPRIRREDWPG
jgi:flavin reductase (DIM6/NTAB) family NADH-FMN oxidoreductase RutF